MYNQSVAQRGGSTLADKHLSKAPIKEAIVGGTVAPALPVSALPELQRCLAKLQDYNPPEPIIFGQAQLTFGPQQPPASQFQQQHLGWRSVSKNGLHVVQARLDAFFFSRLFPYADWAEFTSHAQKAARVVERLYGSSPVNTAVVRYINELSLPFNEKLEEYVNFYVYLPPQFPQHITNMFMRLELQQAADTIVVLHSGFLPAVDNRARLLLDIEVRRTVNSVPMERAWSAIDALREVKNQIFFSCLTEKLEATLR